MTTETATRTEYEKIIDWRLKTLIEGGFGKHEAAIIASRLDIDLHYACDLIAGGCDPKVAFEIVR